jgi:hypothetical protein
MDSEGDVDEKAPAEEAFGRADFDASHPGDRSGRPWMGAAIR